MSYPIFTITEFFTGTVIKKFINYIRLKYIHSLCTIQYNISKPNPEHKHQWKSAAFKSYIVSKIRLSSVCLVILLLYLGHYVYFFYSFKVYWSEKPENNQSSSIFLFRTQLKMQFYFGAAKFIYSSKVEIFWEGRKNLTKYYT